MISKSLIETADIARKYAGDIRPNSKRAVVVALSGNLGSGKTTFAKAFAGALGISEKDVVSPTFVIMKSYDLDPARTSFKKFVHIDAYRLEKAGEIERLGWKELVSDPGNLILIEWPENVEGALPQGARKISFTFVDEGARDIVFE